MPVAAAAHGQRYPQHVIPLLCFSHEWQGLRRRVLLLLRNALSSFGATRNEFRKFLACEVRNRILFAKASRPPTAMADSSKKRKRPSGDASQKPAKLIKVAYAAEQSVYPVIASTPGITAPNVPFKAFTKSRSKAAKHPAPATHDVLLHSSAHAAVDYTAAPTAADQHVKHYLGIYDEAANKLRIVPAYSSTLRVAPRKHAAVNEEAERKARSTYASQREALGKEFGTKKAQKMIASRTENAITKDTKGKGRRDDVQDAVLGAMEDDEDAAPLKQEAMEEELLANKPIPRPNMQAESVEDVYAFNTLVPPYDAKLLQVKDWQEKARNNEPVMFSHRYPADRLGQVGKSENVNRIKALRYLTLLLEFHDALSTGGRGLKKVPKKEFLSKKLAAWPESLVDSVRRRFSDQGQELPKWHQDFLYTHICALALYVDGWRTETSMLKDDLKMETRQVSQYMMELGAKIGPVTEKEREAMGLKSKAQAANVRVARLKLPLEFPKPRVGRKR